MKLSQIDTSRRIRGSPTGDRDHDRTDASHLIHFRGHLAIDTPGNDSRMVDR
jgi:hypothetical protein